MLPRPAILGAMSAPVQIIK